MPALLHPYAIGRPFDAAVAFAGELRPPAHYRQPDNL